MCTVCMCVYNYICVLGTILRTPSPFAPPSHRHDVCVCVRVRVCVGGGVGGGSECITCSDVFSLVPLGILLMMK